MVPVTVKFDEASLAELDAFIERGAAGSRTEALRAALRSWLKSQREVEIVESYRRGYGAFAVDDDPDLAPWASVRGEDFGDDPRTLAP